MLVDTWTFALQKKKEVNGGDEVDQKEAASPLHPTSSNNYFHGFWPLLEMGVGEGVW